MFWLDADPAFIHETHFTDRVVRCYRERPTTIGEMFTAVVAAHPSAEAVVDGDTRLSYGELDNRARKLASALAANGITAGDRIILNVDNGHQFPIAYMAAVFLGAIAVPVGIRQRAPELKFIYNNCEAAAVLFDQYTVGVQPLASATPTVKLRIICGESASVEEDVQVFEQLIDANEPLANIIIPAEDDCVTLLYTSGTTGQPKGAMLTHLGLVHTTLHWVHRFRLTFGERTIVCVPISHVTGLAAQLLVMFATAGCTIMQRDFEVSNFLDLAEHEDLSYCIMVPAIYKLLLLRGDFTGRDFSSWRVGAFGGAPMPEATIHEMSTRLPDLILANAYGATETSSPATIMPLAACRSVVDSIGTTVDCGEILIMDDTGQEVPYGETGEIWIAGPMVVPKYWKRPDADKDFVAGFWKSGDIGSIDEDGFVRIFDRKKDMINRGGYKIFCTEVENVISDYPGVDDVALVPVPCEVLGERVCACIYTQHDEGLNKDLSKGLTGFLKVRVADYKIPDYYHVQSELLPRNANGKIQKLVLRKLAATLFGSTEKYQ